MSKERIAAYGKQHPHKSPYNVCDEAGRNLSNPPEVVDLYRYLIGYAILIRHNSKRKAPTRSMFEPLILTKCRYCLHLTLLAFVNRRSGIVIGPVLFA
jgi:hypothetical protein